MEEKKVAVAGRIEPQINRHYLKVSHKFMAAGIIVLIILLLYIVCVTAFFGEYVTYDNLKYLMRDFETMNVSGNFDFTKIVYNGDRDTSSAYFRNGLALCTSDKYSYYDTSGVLLTEEKLGYSNPVMVPSDKYMLIYDLGGKSYSVFNQLTRIIERETDGEIIAANISDNGEMAIAMRSTETRYAVELYNGAFNKVMSVYKDSYVLDVAVSDDGNTVAICSACPSDSDFDCEIELCRRKQKEPVSIMKYSHTMPLDAYATENGFAVLCSGMMLFFDENGENVKEVSFGGMSLTYADINDVSAAVVGSVNALGSENRVIVFDMGKNFGEVISDSVLGMRIMGVAASRNTDKNTAFLKLHDSAAVMTADGEIIYDTGSGGDIVSIVPLGDGALICLPSSAYIAFNE